MKIQLIDKQYNNEQFQIDYTYKYEFVLNDLLEKHELTFGHTDDLIEILQQEFSQEIKKYLEAKQ